MKNLTLAIVIASTGAMVAAGAQTPSAPLAPLMPVNEGRQRWTLHGDDWTRVQADAYGRIELNEDETDVTSVSPDGWFEISSKNWLSLFGRRYVVRRSPDGTIIRRYTVRGRERPVDAETRAWIAETIQRLVQRGFHAEVRVPRILASRGPAGVLDEIAKLPGDFTKARYLTLLFRATSLDAATAERALQQSREIGSDFEMARVLVAFAETVPLDDKLSAAFIEATGSIGSDYEKSRVLLAVIGNQSVDAPTRQALLEAARGIGSEHERGRVLSALLQTGSFQ